MRSKDYKNGYAIGYITGRAKGRKDNPQRLVLAGTYTVPINEQHIRFMHWLRLKFHDNANWDSGISTISIMEMFKSDAEFQKRYYKDATD